MVEDACELHVGVSGSLKHQADAFQQGNGCGGRTIALCGACTFVVAFVVAAPSHEDVVLAVDATSASTLLSRVHARSAVLGSQRVVLAEELLKLLCQIMCTGGGGGGERRNALFSGWRTTRNNTHTTQPPPPTSQTS